MRSSSSADVRFRYGRWILILMAAGGLGATMIGFLGRWHWYADLFTHLRPQYCVWLVVAALGAGFLRHRTSFVLAIVGLVANGIALAPYAMPWRNSAPAPTVQRTWTFASINLLYGNREVPRVIDYVRQARADVVLFQEVSPRWSKALEELRDLYPHRLVQSRKDGFGLALFSREPPVEVAKETVGIRAGDLAMFATWESAGRRFGLAGIHPDKPDQEWKTRNRTVYLGAVEKWCAAKALENVPVVVIGDFNATPWSSSLQRFVANTGLRNCNQGTIFRATWNVWQPHQLLIDHAFFSSHWQLLDREIGPGIGSDHRPLLVRAAL